MIEAVFEISAVDFPTEGEPWAGLINWPIEKPWVDYNLSFSTFNTASTYLLERLEKDL